MAEETKINNEVATASDPIPVSAPQLDPLSLLMGWKAGNWVARQRGKKAEEEKTPIAYLYNGVRLPKLPEWDKTVYPYALIDYWDSSMGGYILRIFSSPTDFYVIDGKSVRRAGKSSLTTVYDPNSNSDGWEEFFGGTADDEDLTLFPLVWSSVDLLNTDGSVYLAASEPVPVYE